ncbi:aldehyde-alcohol dehydrogenase [Desulfosporosinus acididurans]|uniref:Aldehyde-alcohol dehydrogenase n=1 Tax=Desulfosporosinus acididurans TaxID=476652 RepID=A0A0J1FRH7_9FIRM|nr:iron-containing alcohol dehydrogenase [Desulfosporosinus acididurans]KLU65912.1 aldehyde-alcohol dehydrogenase [Desulfosporosinus acididurans]
MDLKWFRVPRDVVFGAGTLEYLKQVQGSKAFICMGKNSMRANGVLDKVTGYLKEANIDYTIFDGVEGDPSVETVYRGAEKMKAFAPDLILGLGGCSAIDAAKAMWVFYEYPDKRFEDIKAPFSIPPLRNKAKFIAIPSTSGTGTEVTCVAVITEQGGIKHPLASYEITPDIAILDPEICLSMPPNVTADTGVDALSHALEAYVSTMANDYTDTLALESIKTIFEWLPKAFKDGSDITARTKMHIAQNYAGMSFSNAILGIDHSLSHKISTINTTHGRCNTILMPAVIQYNSKVAGQRYAQIAKYLELPGSSNEELISSLVITIKNLNSSLGIPASLKELGMDESSFLENVETFAKAALEDPCTGTNPRQPSVEDLIQVYKAAYYGYDVVI